METPAPKRRKGELEVSYEGRQEAKIPTGRPQERWGKTGATLPLILFGTGAGGDPGTFRISPFPRSNSRLWNVCRPNFIQADFLPASRELFESRVDLAVKCAGRPKRVLARPNLAYGRSKGGDPR
jgi:hypothetical protein